MPLRSRRQEIPKDGGIFPNCPRYIHRMQLAEASPYVPRQGVEPPVPAWKRFEMFSDVLPRDGRGGSGSESG